MRIVHWMLLVSTLLFVASIWFLIAGAREAAPAAPAVAPVATVKQIMNGIVTPASTVVYRAVSTVITAEGVVETAPQNDTEWEMVGSGAAALIEAGRLMMEPGRAQDDGEWMTMSQAMIDTSTQALDATVAKDPDALLAAGEVLNASCDSCHRRYAPDL